MHHTPLIKDQPIASNGCSIPSRYQTYIVDNSDQKGFHSGTKRFQNFDVSDTPGPGHYNQVDNTILKARENKNEQIKKAHDQQSRNKKINKNKSISEYQGSQESIRFQTPGPNSYNVAKPMSMRKDHHRANSSSFQSVRTNRSKFNTPGPNAYQPKRPKQQSISSCFKSTSQARAVLGQQKNQRVPSPTHYLIKSNLDVNPRAPTSCFLSTTGRSEISYKTAKGAFYQDTNATTNNTPGPGSYGNISKWGKEYNERNSEKWSSSNQFNSNAKKRGHYLAISAPAIPLPPSKSLPGPGEYELVDYNGPRREARGSSMFSSNTDRWHRDKRYAYISKGLPGPADYNPKGIDKQSFIFNYGRRFIN